MKKAIIDFESWLDCLDPTYQEINDLYEKAQSILGAGSNEMLPKTDGSLTFMLANGSEIGYIIDTDSCDEMLRVSNEKSIKRFIAVLDEKYGIDGNIHGWYELERQAEKDRGRNKDD